MADHTVYTQYVEEVSSSCSKSQQKVCAGQEANTSKAEFFIYPYTLKISQSLYFLPNIISKI